MKSTKTILICPLDWGLGHATRCVPLINQFLEEGNEVIIGADKNPLAFLKQEFPTLKTVVIPGYEVTYGEKGSALKLFYESVKFFNFIKEEHQFIDKIITENKIDLIVSDNRYGLYSDKVKSIIVTHQLYVKAPVGEKIAHKKIEKLISNFDECWIPDAEGEPNLSGDLSHLKPFNHPHKFIGSLSRFTKLLPEHVLRKQKPRRVQFVTSSVFEERKNVSRSEQTYDYDIIAILSGPEPQRTIFEGLIFEQIEKCNLKAVIVLGKPLQSVIARTKGEAISFSEDKIASSSRKVLPRNDENTKIFNHLPTEELYEYIQKSNVVVCRAGYSSIMDLAALGKKAILIPTPGQTEQEYLAKYHLEQGNFYSQKQSEFDLEKGLTEVKCFNPKIRAEDKGVI